MIVPTFVWHLVWQSADVSFSTKAKWRAPGESKCQIDYIDESYKYLGILQTFGNNDEEVCCKATTEYRNQVRWVLRNKLSRKNEVTAIKTFTVPVIRYPAAVVNWRREYLKETDIGTRKLMTMHSSIPSRAILGWNTSRKDGGRCCAPGRAEPEVLCQQESGKWPTDGRMQAPHSYLERAR